MIWPNFAAKFSSKVIRQWWLCVFHFVQIQTCWFSSNKNSMKPLCKQFNQLKTVLVACGTFTVQFHRSFVNKIFSQRSSNLFLGLEAVVAWNKSRFYVLLQTNGADLDAMCVLVDFLDSRLLAEAQQPLQRPSLVASIHVKVYCSPSSDLLDFHRHVDVDWRWYQHSCGSICISWSQNCYFCECWN